MINKAFEMSRQVSLKELINFGMLPINSLRSQLYSLAILNNAI
jgi:hypothetical protein